MALSRNKVAIIGGSGVHDSPVFNNLEFRLFDTEYPNDYDGNGVVEYQERDDGVIFIPRHGNNVKYGPSSTQYGANLIAAKMLGADVVIATSAVGSLDGKLIPIKSLVIPDDYIDESLRNDNLFGKGFIVHTNPIPAFSEGLRGILYSSAQEDIECFAGGIYNHGTYVCIPGDRFGTKAEGAKRARYAQIVGMTICPEAAMAMQLGMHYAVAAFVVDVNEDANHENGTLAVMKELSAAEKVPAYIERVITKAKVFAEHAGQITNLRGNIIASPNYLNYIKNKHLQEIAEKLTDTYCK